MFSRKGHSLQEMNRKVTGKKGGGQSTLWLGIVDEILNSCSQKVAAALRRRVSGACIFKLRSDQTGNAGMERERESGRVGRMKGEPG